MTNKGHTKEALKQKIRDAIFYEVAQFGPRPWIVDALVEVAMEIADAPDVGTFVRRSHASTSGGAPR